MYADVLSAKESRDLYDWMKQNKLPIDDNGLTGYAEYEGQYPKCRIIQAHYHDAKCTCPCYAVVWPDIAGQPRSLHITDVVLTDNARERLYDVHEDDDPLEVRAGKRKEWIKHFGTLFDPHAESSAFRMPTTNLREFLNLRKNASKRSLKIRLIELMLLFKPSMLTEDERKADRGEFKLIQAIRGTCMPSFSHVLMCALTCVYADKLCPDFDLQDPDNWINANLLISSCFTHACMHTHTCAHIIYEQTAELMSCRIHSVTQEADDRAAEKKAAEAAEAQKLTEQL